MARKERLRALKQAAELVQGDLSAAKESEDDKPVLKFRNYVVQDKKIDHEKVAPAQPPTIEEPTVDRQPEKLPQEELLINVAPKKANWDLKRDIAARLDKLERRTQKAILEILREEERQRLEQEGGIQD